MNRIFERVFGSGDKFRRPPGASSVSSELTHRDIQNYYIRVILDCLRRMLVPLLAVGLMSAGLFEMRKDAIASFQGRMKAALRSSALGSSPSSG